jgi:hypothetical protein
VVEVPKEELGPLRIKRWGDSIRLIYDGGADRVEVGRYLREPEKKWLAKVIKNWQRSALHDETDAGEA